MDNKPQEDQSESYVKSQLIKFGFKVMKPSFDKKGADLIIIDSIERKYTKFLILQCKGRVINSKSTPVKIPIVYVEDNFILFIHTVDEKNNDRLFLFFAEEIRNWGKNNTDYTITLNNKKVLTEYFIQKQFDDKLAEKLKLLLNKTEIKNYTSVIIDGIFLEKALLRTIQTYSEIWPDKKFTRPDLNTVIKSILDSYDRYKTETKIVNCYVLLSESFALDSIIDINQVHQTFKTNKGNQVKVFINKTDEIIAFEVLEQLNRLINNDNIILVADDILYEDALNELKGKGVEIIVVMFKLQDGGRMIIKFKWGDVMYPLGIALGLDDHEL